MPGLSFKNCSRDEGEQTYEKRASLLAYNRQLGFEELLNKDKSVAINHRNLEVLATELHKIITN